MAVRFDLTDHASPNRYRLVLSTEQAEVCVKHAAYPADLVITTDTIWLFEWHLGEATLAQAMHVGRFRVDGPPALIRAFGQWGRVEPVQAHPPCEAPGPRKLASSLLESGILGRAS